MQQVWDDYKVGIQYEVTQEWITQIMGALLSLRSDVSVDHAQLEDDVTLLAGVKRELTCESQAVTDARNIINEIMSRWKIQ